MIRVIAPTIIYLLQLLLLTYITLSIVTILLAFERGSERLRVCVFPPVLRDGELFSPCNRFCNISVTQVHLKGMHTA